jgi:hypothetical protein
VHGLASRLKKLTCEKFLFGERVVFGRKELNDGEYLEKNKEYYDWPQRKIHKLSRDPHPDLEERFSVPDEKVSWASYPDDDFQIYKPQFATDADKTEALKNVLERRKAAVQQSRFKGTMDKLGHSRLAECHDLAVELSNTTCRPEDKSRNPCGRWLSFASAPNSPTE